MRQDRGWKLIAIAFIAALLYAGYGLHRLSGGEPLSPTADAQMIGPAITQDAEDVLVTSSVDGRTIYLWTFGPWNLNERRVPEFRRAVCVPKYE
jgi:hypothetical protein